MLKFRLTLLFHNDSNYLFYSPVRMLYILLKYNLNNEPMKNMESFHKDLLNNLIYSLMRISNIAFRCNLNNETKKNMI